MAVALLLILRAASATAPSITFAELADATTAPTTPSSTTDPRWTRPDFRLDHYGSRMCPTLVAAELRIASVTSGALQLVQYRAAMAAQKRAKLSEKGKMLGQTGSPRANSGQSLQTACDAEGDGSSSELDADAADSPSECDENGDEDGSDSAKVVASAAILRSFIAEPELERRKSEAQAEDFGWS